MDKKTTKILIIFVLFFIGFILQFSSSNAMEARILVINSYHRGFSWTDNQINGIDSAFAESGLKYDLEIKYLDTKHTPSSPEYYEHFYNLFRFRSISKLPDLIITTDDDALNFVLEYKEKLFPGIPHVFCGVSMSNDLKLQALKNITGIYDDADIKKNIDLAIKLFPNTKNLVFVHDQTTTGLSQAKEAERLIDKYPGYVFFFITDMPILQIQNSIANLPEKSAVFYLTFNVDKDGDDYTHEESSKIILTNCKSPVFGERDAYLGNGILGGNVIYGFEHGKQAGKIAVSILKGSNINNIPIVKEPISTTVFDFNLLTKFNLKSNVLPVNSIIINEPITFFTRHKNVLIPAVIIILLQLLILIVLFVNILKKRRAVNELSLSEQRFRTFIEDAPVSILISKNGVVRFANKFLIHLLGYKKDNELLNKPITDLVVTPERTKISDNNRKRESGDYVISSYETIALKSDGTEFPILVEAKAIKLPEGLSTIVFIKDFTEIKEYIGKIEESENNYKNLLDSIPSSIFKFDKNWNCLVANTMAYKYFRLASSIVPSTVDDINEEIDKISIFSDVKQLDLVSNKAYYLTEYKMSDKRTRWVEVIVNALSDGNLVIINDITEKITSEQSIKEQAELLEHVSDAIISFDTNFNVRTWNKSAEHIYGWTMNEAIGSNMNDILLPVEAPDDSDFWKIYNEREFWHSDLKFFKQNNEIVEVHCHLTQIKGKDGNILGGVCVNRDITKLKRTEEFMKLSQLCLDNAEDIIMWFDSEGTIQYANQSACTILGYSKEELLKFGAYDVVGPHTIESWANYWDDLKSKGSITYDAYLKTKSGEILPYEKNANYLEIEDKQYNFSFLRNIAERKKHETALANEKERLAVTLRSIGDGVIVTDTEGRITLINKSAELMTGCFNDEVQGMNTVEVYKVLDEKTKIPQNELFASVTNGGYAAENIKNKILVASDGKERIISESIAPIKDKNSETIGYVLVFRDITDKVIYEKELETAEKLRSIGVLAGGIAHDFNNILTAIVGNLALAENQIEHKNMEKILDILKNTEKAAFRAKNLTKQFLTFAKGGEPISKSVNLGEIITDSASFAIRGSNVKLKLELDEDLSPVYVDDGQISQVVQNLVINAVQAMDAGGSIILRAENVSLDGSSMKKIPLNPGDYVMVSVVDFGIGIPQNIISKIFDPYFTTKSDGTGLGLATSFSIISKHNGFLTVDSDVNKGSIFSFYLPVADSEPVTSDAVKIIPANHDAKILIMDDDLMIRETISEIVSILGFECFTAETGEQAIEIYKQSVVTNSPIDIIIMDLTVPGGKGGKEAVVDILKINPDAKVVVSSGHSTDPIMSDFRNYGFCAVLVKPYEMKEFTMTINTILNL